MGFLSKTGVPLTSQSPGAQVAPWQAQRPPEAALRARAPACGNTPEEAVKGPHLWSACCIPSHEKPGFEVRLVARGHTATALKTCTLLTLSPGVGLDKEH